jgi:probable phosphoglycerate mutase
VAQHVVLIRHGETEWTVSHRHTGRTDIPLNPHGEQRARLLAPLLAALDDMAGWRLDHAAVFTSPLLRARRTCELAGFGSRATVLDDLVEWDYGEFEGTKTSELRESDPDWSIWTTEITRGESLADVGARADRVVGKLDGIDGCVVLFAHAHFLRIFGARWCGFPPDGGRRFTLDPASISVLGYERETKVVQGWNRSPHV